MEYKILYTVVALASLSYFVLHLIFKFKRKIILYQKKVKIYSDFLRYKFSIKYQSNESLEQLYEALFQLKLFGSKEVLELVEEVKFDLNNVDDFIALEKILKIMRKEIM